MLNLDRFYKIAEFTVLVLFVGIGCADKNSGSKSSPAPIGMTNPALCGTGQVNHPNYGCLAQGNCPINQGVYNGQCVPLMAQTPVGGAGYQYGAGVCNGGQIYSYYGCVPTAGCQANHGMYNGQCVPSLAITPTGVPNGFNSYNGMYGGYNGMYGGGNSYYDPYYSSWPSSYYYYSYPRFNSGLNFYMRF